VICYEPYLPDPVEISLAGYAGKLFHLPFEKLFPHPVVSFGVPFIVLVHG
jgi:hypothetical protein